MSRWDDELTIACPLCRRPAGRMCVYTTAPPGCGHQVHQETKIPHPERRKIGSVIRSRRAEQKRLEAMASVILAPVSITAWGIAAALGEYDRRERADLRAWLAVHGHILWEHPDY